MCEFISWIEKNNEIYWITDKDLEDKYIKKHLKETKDNDVISHGFIRKVYNLEGGTEYECQDIWNKNKFPMEIQKTLGDNFSKYYSKIFSKYLQNNDLRYIIEYGNDKYQELAWNQLLKQNPDNFDMLYIIEYSNDKYQELAWNQLLKQNPDNFDMRYIIEFGAEKYKELAWNQLLKQNSDNFDMRYIIEFGPEKYKELAWNQLLKQNPNNFDMRHIIKYGRGKYKALARKELNKNISKLNNQYIKE